MHQSQNWDGLHDRPAEKRDQNHRQPGRHLGQVVRRISVRHGQVELVQLAVEWVEEALVRLDIFNLVVDDQCFERLRGGAGAVQRLVPHHGDGRRLVGQRLGDGEVVERWRADGPRVAEKCLFFAVEVGEFGRAGLCGKEGEGCLLTCQFWCAK